MKILSRYVVVDFLRYLFYTLLAMLLLLIVSAMFGDIEAIFSSWQRFVNFLDSSLRGIPVSLEIVLPFSILLATVFTFNNFSRSSELLAMKSSGMGTGRMIKPILIVLIPISLLAYFNQNYLYNALNPEPYQTSASWQNDQWRSSGKNIFFLTSYHPQKNQIKNGFIFQWRPDPFRISQILRFSNGSRQKESWVFQDVNRGRQIDEVWKFENLDRMEVPADDFPDLYKSFDLDAHHMPFFDLNREIGQLENRDPRVVVYLLEWYQKTAALFIPIIMVMVGAPLSQFHIRKGRVAGEIVVTIFGGIVFWISNEIFLIFGKGGFFHPIISAWGANLLFFLLGLALLWRIR